MKTLILTLIVLASYSMTFSAHAQSVESLECELQTLARKELIKFELPINSERKSINFIADVPNDKEFEMQIKANFYNGNYSIDAQVFLPSESTKIAQALTRAKDRDLFLQLSFVDGFNLDYPKSFFLINISCK